MKIGILGSGSIGTTLARTLAAAGHHIKIANSRGPETISATALENGAIPVTAEDAVKEVGVVIMSMPQNAFEKVRPLVTALPEAVVVIDTSNYFPQRDGVNPAIEAGEVESVWIQNFFGRPIVKAWNAIGAVPFAENGLPKGHPERVALPVAGDRDHDREVAIALINDTGFDGYDAGLLKDSWRQQPGAPVYCTNLRYGEIGPALAAAERERLPQRRNLSVAIFAERFGPGVNPDAATIVRISRALQM
ncbi:NAD(P)-binding domain-containing protein [Enterobacter cancerogenus]|uniref:NADPH-dependent F420 reductase n=1 Tax=Enterobacter cancerogenus TaxID=69218 RepID=UPI0030763F9A